MSQFNVGDKVILNSWDDGVHSSENIRLKHDEIYEVSSVPDGVVVRLKGQGSTRWNDARFSLHQVKRDEYEIVIPIGTKFGAEQVLKIMHDALGDFEAEIRKVEN